MRTNEHKENLLYETTTFICGIGRRCVTAGGVWNISPGPPPTPTNSPTPADSHAEEDTGEYDEEAGEMELSEEATAGLEIFQTVGCAACHGQNGEGNVGPALAGHTREQVFNQLRAPKGDIMPPFPTDKLSDADVEKVVAWIATLGDEMVMEHDDEGEMVMEGGSAEMPELTMTEIDHLRLVLDALSAENQIAAIHHAQHLVDGGRPEVKPVAEKLLADLEANKNRDVEAQAGEILGPLADKAFDAVSVHLGMALAANQRDDLADVEHHLESAVAAAADHDHQPEMQRLLDDWRKGDDPHSVIDHLYEALGLEHPVHQ